MDICTVIQYMCVILALPGCEDDALSLSLTLLLLSSSTNNNLLALLMLPMLCT